jgi:anti-sigma factor RsiW
MSDVRMDERLLLSVAEAASYARVSTTVLAGLPVVVADPWSSSGSLVERRAVDAWWREQVLARPVA